MERGQNRGMKRLYHYTPMLILAIFTTMVMVAGQLLMFCNTMVFNTDHYVNVISESGADDALYDELDTYFARLSAPTGGIPKEVFTKSLDKKTVSLTAKKLTKDSLDYTFGKSNTKPSLDYDFAPLERDITEYIENYSESHQIEKDAEYYTIIDNTVNVAEKKLETGFDIMMARKLSQSSVPSITRRLVPSLDIMLGVCVVTLVGLLGLMFYIDRHHPCDMPYWIGTILFGGSSLLLIPTVYCRATDYFDGLFIDDQSVFCALTGALYSITDRIILVNVILFALGIVLIVFAQVIHVFRVRDARRSRHSDE